MCLSAKLKTIALALVSCGLLSIALVSVPGCGSSETRTEDHYECYDWVGNQLRNCTATIYDHSNNARIDEYLHDVKVGGVYIKQNYDQWVAAGKPESEVSYRYYCAYTENGDDHALLYVNSETRCWAYAVKGKSEGHAIGSVYFGEDGYAYEVNTVTGDRNSDNEKQNLMRLNYDYFEKASQVIASLDPDYLPSLDPSSSVKVDQLMSEKEARESDTHAEEDAVVWSDAKSCIGETVTVCGPVLDASYMSNSNGKPTFIDIGEKYPSNNGLSVVIWGEDRGNFDINPEDAYSAGTIYVTGVPYERNGHLYIKVTDPGQIALE